jgi:putative aldouronate transport system substrate-binding protein
MLNKEKRIALLVLAALAAAAPFLSAGGRKPDPAPAPAAQAGGPVTYPVSGSPKLTFARTLDPDLQTSGYSSYKDAPGFQEWQRRTGIEVEIIEPADANAFLLYLAGGNLPDIIHSGKRFYPGGIPKMHADGLASNLTDMLPKYAPDYWNLINSDPRYSGLIKEADGKYYAVAGYLKTENDVSLTWAGLVIRKEFLDKLNMAPPETPSEMYTYLSRIKKELNVEVPFCSDKFRWPYNFDWGCITSGFNLPRTTAYQINGKVHYGAYESAYKDVMAWLNKLYTEKLLDNNFAVTDEPTAHSNMLSGKSGLITTAASRVGNMTMAANRGDFTLMGLSSLTPQRGVKPAFVMVDNLVSESFWGFIPETSRNKEAALKFLNYPYTKDGIILTNFGQEGETFAYVNGTPKYTEFVTKNPKGIALDGLMRVHGLLNFPVLFDPNMSLQRFGLPQQIQAMSAWANHDAAKYLIVNNSIAADFADEYATLMTDIDTFIKESQAQFISGALPLDRFDSYYIATLKRMGMDRLLEILQTSYDIYNK